MPLFTATGRWANHRHMAGSHFGMVVSWLWTNICGVARFPFQSTRAAAADDSQIYIIVTEYCMQARVGRGAGPQPIQNHTAAHQGDAGAQLLLHLITSASCSIHQQFCSPMFYIPGLQSLGVGSSGLALTGWWRHKGHKRLNMSPPVHLLVGFRQSSTHNPSCRKSCRSNTLTPTCQYLPQFCPFPLLEEGSGPAYDILVLLSTGDPQLSPHMTLKSSTRMRPLAPLPSHWRTSLG